MIWESLGKDLPGPSHLEAPAPAPSTLANLPSVPRHWQGSSCLRAFVYASSLPRTHFPPLIHTHISAQLPSSGEPSLTSQSAQAPVISSLSTLSVFSS